MTSKNKLTYGALPFMAAATFTLPFSTATDAALVTIDSPAHLFFNGSATARWNDNIFLQSDNEEKDVLLLFAPGLELNIGDDSRANINVYYRHDFHVYTDNSRLDDDYSNLFLETTWDQARLDLSFDASFQQIAQALPDIPGLADLVERDNYRADLSGEYDLTERTSLASGINYSRTNYTTSGLNLTDRDSIGVPLNAYYALTPLVDISAGYRFRHTETEGGAPDYNDNYFNVGARGELAPKLIGEARVGYQHREVKDDQFDDEDGISFGIDFSHFTTAKTTLLAGAYQDFSTGARGSSLTTTGGSLGVQHTFNHLFSGNAGVNYFERDWDRVTQADANDFNSTTRNDETLDLNVGMTYSPNVYVDLSASYIFRTNDSNVNFADFDNNIVSLSAALRY